MFCTRSIDESKVASILQNLLDVDAAKIKSFYAQWRDNRSRGMYQVPREALTPVFTEFARTGSLLGVDIPVWFDSNGSSSPVMLICQDPLRSDTDFKCIDRQRTILVGSPFSVHLDPALGEPPEGYGRSGKYWAFIDAVAREHLMYITDIWKLCFRDKNGPSNAISRFCHHSIHRDLVYKEIKLVKPHLIVILGTNAVRALGISIGRKITDPIQINNLPVYEGIPVVAFPHLSSIATKHSKSFLQRSGYEASDVSIDYSKIVSACLSAPSVG